MPYKIGTLTFNLKQLSLREDEKLAHILEEVFGMQQADADAAHEENKKKLQSDIPFIQTQFINDAVVITGGFLSKLLESGNAPKIADLFLQVDSKLTLLASLLWRVRIYRLYYLSKHIKGELKGKLFTDFFSEGTVYASSLVNHFLILLSSRIAQQEELRKKENV